MSENTEVKQDQGGIYGPTPAIVNALERQVMTKTIMKNVSRVVRELAHETVSGATKVINGVEKFPGTVSRDDLQAILTRLLPGQFPNSEGLAFNAPDAKFPPMFPPNKKDENGNILRNEEGFAIKDYSYLPAAGVVKGAYNGFCLEVKRCANPDPENKRHVLCQIDPQKHQAVLDSMVKGDMGALRDRMFSPSSQHVATIINKLGVGPTNTFKTVRNEGDKPVEGALLMDSWTQAAREMYILDFARAYGAKCAAPREDCPDGMRFESKTIIDYFKDLGFDMKSPAYLNIQGAVSLEHKIIAIAYASYKSSFAHYHGESTLPPPSEAVQKAVAAVPEKDLQQIEQTILANADAAPMLMTSAGVESILKDMAKEASQEMKDEVINTANRPDEETAKKKPGRPRKA